MKIWNLLQLLLILCFAITITGCSDDDDDDDSQPQENGEVSDLQGSFYFENASDLQLEITSINESEATFSIPDYLVTGRRNATFTGTVNVTESEITVTIDEGTTAGDKSISGNIVYNRAEQTVTYNIIFDGTSYSGNAYNLNTGAGLGFGGNGCTAGAINTLQQEILSAASTLLAQVQANPTGNFQSALTNYYQQIRNFYVVIQDNCGVDLSAAIDQIDALIDSLG